MREGTEVLSRLEVGGVSSHTDGLALDRSMGSLFTVAGEKMGYMVTDAEAEAFDGGGYGSSLLKTSFSQ